MAGALRALGLLVAGIAVGQVLPPLVAPDWPVFGIERAAAVSLCALVAGYVVLSRRRSSGSEDVGLSERLAYRLDMW